MGCVEVLYFAGMADITKVGSERVDLDNNDGHSWSVQDVLEVLVKKYGAEFTKVLDTCMFAVDMEYVSRTHPLHSSQELAIIPPVSGG